MYVAKKLGAISALALNEEVYKLLWFFFSLLKPSIFFQTLKQPLR